MTCSLNQLPDELNVFTVTSRENEHTAGFFGEINPLSNFYPSSFSHEGVNYISSEQLIQANKAKFFGYLESYNQILSCSTSLQCKNLSKLIRNVDESKWEEEAGNICFTGIRAKFYQNPVTTDTLLYKTGNKKIIECASDRLWGNGMPLGNPACLDSTKLISQGILGQMLECIHSEVTQPRANLIINRRSPHLPHSLHSNNALPCLRQNQPTVLAPLSPVNQCLYYLPQTWLLWKNLLPLIWRTQVLLPPLYQTQLLLTQTKVVHIIMPLTKRHKWRRQLSLTEYELTLLGVSSSTGCNINSD